MKILIVEDNLQVMETLCDYLMLDGHIVECAYDGKAALSLLGAVRFDVIIMDIMMPRLNGIETVAAIRQTLHLSTPILFLTAKDAISDKLDAFNAGGDDYLVKPFDMKELELRVTALSKRGERIDVTPIRVGELSFIAHKDHFTYAESILKLSPKQHLILKELITAYPATVSRERMTEALWGDESPDSDALRSHVYSLRSHLKKVAGKDLLGTAYGKGFNLVL
ncbi:response regulator transcription factor [Alteromonas confluentis]|uniref:Two-component system response regulator n=1 Tax=Alteromonas confluentis TaxID=1656094 RepID=A0A1E7Z7D0_9ALTE|nr:response regulator transcription factor [Alteromonas confluentis]OFC69420.1 two-component system response regulator [Alteromonas confluentis]